MQSKFCISEIDNIQLIFNSLEINGCSIESESSSENFRSEIQNHISVYITDESKSDLLLTLFKLYCDASRRKLEKIDISSKFKYKITISKFVYWEFIALNDFDFKMLGNIADNLENQISLVEYVESFLYSYLNHILSFKNLYNIQIRKFLCLSKRLPIHSVLCPLVLNNKKPENLVFRNVFIKSIPIFCEWMTEQKDVDFCKRCVTTIDSSICTELIFTILSSFEVNFHNYLKDISNEKFQSMWKISDLSSSVNFINKIYNGLYISSPDISTSENIDQCINHLFDSNHQMLLLILHKCLSLNMHLHLADYNNDIEERSNVYDDYILASSTVIINIILTVVLESEFCLKIPSLKYDLNMEIIKKLCRKFLKVSIKYLKNVFESVFTDKNVHIDFLMWCLKSNIYTKEIFTWFVDSSIFDSIIEDKFLTHFNDVVGSLSDPLSCMKLAERLCIVNRMNLPSHRYIKLLKLMIFKLPVENKKKTLTGLSKIQVEKIFCPSVSFEASLRKSCNQLSGDIENLLEVQLDLEYLLFVDPISVISELLKCAFFKSGTKEFVLKLMEKFSYAFCAKIVDSKMVIIRVFENLFFQEIGDFRFNTFTKNDVQEDISFCLQNIFDTMKDNSVGDRVLTDLIVPHLHKDDTFFIQSCILLLSILKHPSLQNKEFLSKMNVLLVTLTHLHLSLCQNASNEILTYVEMSIRILMTDLLYSIDKTKMMIFVDLIPFSCTKLLFWELCVSEKKQISLPANKAQFLSQEVMEKYNFKMSLEDFCNTFESFSLLNDFDIIHDFGAIVTLCSASPRFLEISLEALLSFDNELNAWKALCRSHVITVLLRIVSFTNVEGWLNILKFLQVAIENNSIVWLYHSISSLTPMIGDKDFKSNLLLLSLIQCLLDLGCSVKNKTWLSKLVKLVIASLSLLIPRAALESNDSLYFFVKFEILLHLLKMCKSLRFKGEYGLKSVLLFAEPMMIKLADESLTLPREMQRLMIKLADFEIFLSE